MERNILSTPQWSARGLVHRSKRTVSLTPTSGLEHYYQPLNFGNYRLGNWETIWPCFPEDTIRHSRCFKVPYRSKHWPLIYRNYRQSNCAFQFNYINRESWLKQYRMTCIPKELGSNLVRDTEHPERFFAILSPSRPRPLSPQSFQVHRTRSSPHIIRSWITATFDKMSLNNLPSRTLSDSQTVVELVMDTISEVILGNSNKSESFFCPRATITKLYSQIERQENKTLILFGSGRCLSNWSVSLMKTFVNEPSGSKTLSLGIAKTFAIHVLPISSFSLGILLLKSSRYEAHNLANCINCPLIFLNR